MIHVFFSDSKVEKEKREGPKTKILSGCKATKKTFKNSKGEREESKGKNCKYLSTFAFVYVNVNATECKSKKCISSRCFLIKCRSCILKSAKKIWKKKIKVNICI